MRWRAEGNMRLGSNVVELLIPHRRPFLFVDFVDSFFLAPVPTLEAGKQVSANEPVFNGHFPDLHIWPGTLTIEGLGQASAILMVLVGIRRVAEQEGLDPDVVLGGLRNFNLGFQLQPGYRPDEGGALLTRLAAGHHELAVNASVDVKLHRPVFAGQRIDYLVAMAGELGPVVRCEVEACVDGAVVASGILAGARVPRPRWAGRGTG